MKESLLHRSAEYPRYSWKDPENDHLLQTLGFRVEKLRIARQVMHYSCEGVRASSYCSSRNRMAHISTRIFIFTSCMLHLSRSLAISCACSSTAAVKSSTICTLTLFCLRASFSSFLNSSMSLDFSFRFSPAFPDQDHIQFASLGCNHRRFDLSLWYVDLSPTAFSQSCRPHFSNRRGRPSLLFPRVEKGEPGDTAPFSNFWCACNPWWTTAACYGRAVKSAFLGTASPEMRRNRSQPWKTCGRGHVNSHPLVHLPRADRPFDPSFELTYSKVLAKQGNDNDGM